MRINQRDNTPYRNPQSLHDEEIANNEIDDAIDSSIAARVNGYEDGVLDTRDGEPTFDTDDWYEYMGSRHQTQTQDLYDDKMGEAKLDRMYDVQDDENEPAWLRKEAKGVLTPRRIFAEKGRNMKISHDANRPWGKIKNNPHFPDEDEEEAPKTEEQKMLEKLYAIMQLGENITDQTYSAIDNLKRYYSEGTPESKNGYEKDIDFIINYFKTGLADARFFKNYFIDDYLD